MKNFGNKALTIVLASTLAAGTAGIGTLTVLAASGNSKNSYKSVSASVTNTGDSSENQGNTSDSGKSSGNIPPEKPGENSGNSGETSGAEQSGQEPGKSTAVTSWNAAAEISKDTETTDDKYDSTGTDENSVHVSSGNVILNNASVTRTNSDETNSDNSSFYGVGAAILNTGGTLKVNGGEVTTDANGGAGIFSYGDGVTYAKGVTINTSKDSSGGIHVAGGGTLYAYGLDVTTQGGSAAAIRSDRGGGKMVVDGGTYTSNGSGSPAIYSTADIAVNDAALTANGSEGVCIEGKNSVHLYNSTLTSNMSDNSQNDTTWSVIVYQSMSGDSEEGNGTFSMNGGSITSKNGGLFYTTNTKSTFYLESVNITSSSDSEFFLQATGNSNERGWGTSGKNGADTDFTASDQKMNGDVIYDSISNLDFYMENGSTLTGGFIDDETWAGSGNETGKEANLYISDDSTWVVTKDSTVTNLYNEGKIVDKNGKTVTIISKDGTVYVDGDGSVTVTVDKYSEKADFTNASSSGKFSDYAVNEPDELTAAALASSVDVSNSSSSQSASDSDEVAEVTAEQQTEASADTADTKAADKKISSNLKEINKNGWITAGVILAILAVAGIITAVLKSKSKNKKK